MSSDGQAPRVRVAPARPVKTFGDVAADFVSDYGLTPDPWQEAVLDDWLAADRSDHWKALTCGLSVPRQNGKNALLEMREVFGMVGLGEKILHTAHEVKTAQAHFRRLKHFFGDSADDAGANFPELNALVKYVRNVNGQEEIALTNGASVRVVARSKSSGRGFTADVLVMDEAQELNDDALEALLSATSAAPTGNPQWIYTGTPPGPNAAGEVFGRVRTEALDEHPKRLCWHEWSPDPDQPLNLDDKALWRATNPALHVGRLQLTVCEGERNRLSEAGFARERLGAWPAIAGARRAIDPTTWANTVKNAPADGIRSFAVAFSADGKRQALAGAVKHAEGVHVNVIGAYTGTTSKGVAQVADWLADPDRRTRTAQINLLGGAGASALSDALIERGVPKRVIHVMTTGDYLASCAMTFEGLRAGTITHPLGEDTDALNLSVAVCDRQTRRRDGAYGWEATTSDGDETPLEAVSAAVHAAKTTRRRPRAGRGADKTTRKGVRIL